MNEIIDMEALAKKLKEIEEEKDTFVAKTPEEISAELEKLKKKVQEEPEEEPKEPEPEPPELPERDKSGKFVKKDPETPTEEEGEEESTPMTEKEIADLVAKKVREALKITRKTPPPATPSDKPVSRKTITKNWFEVIV